MLPGNQVQDRDRYDRGTVLHQKMRVFASTDLKGEIDWEWGCEMKRGFHNLPGRHGLIKFFPLPIQNG